MKIIWSEKSWKDYDYFKNKNLKIYNKINSLLNDIIKNNYTGLGKPEPLKHDLTGYWSRRISKKHRLVYYMKDNYIYVVQCRFHY